VFLCFLVLFRPLEFRLWSDANVSECEVILSDLLGRCPEAQTQAAEARQRGARCEHCVASAALVFTPNTLESVGCFPSSRLQESWELVLYLVDKRGTTFVNVYRTFLDFAKVIVCSATESIWKHAKQSSQRCVKLLWRAHCVSQNVFCYALLSILLMLFTLLVPWNLPSQWKAYSEAMSKSPDIVVLLPAGLSWTQSKQFPRHMY